MHLWRGLFLTLEELEFIETGIGVTIIAWGAGVLLRLFVVAADLRPLFTLSSVIAAGWGRGAWPLALFSFIILISILFKSIAWWWRIWRVVAPGTWRLPSMFILFLLSCLHRIQKLRLIRALYLILVLLLFNFSVTRFTASEATTTSFTLFVVFLYTAHKYCWEKFAYTGRWLLADIDLGGLKSLLHDLFLQFLLLLLLLDLVVPCALSLLLLRQFGVGSFRHDLRLSFSTFEWLLSALLFTFNQFWHNFFPVFCTVL